MKFKRIGLRSWTEGIFIEGPPIYSVPLTPQHRGISLSMWLICNVSYVTMVTYFRELDLNNFQFPRPFRLLKTAFTGLTAGTFVLNLFHCGQQREGTLINVKFPRQESYGGEINQCICQIFHKFREDKSSVVR